MKNGVTMAADVPGSPRFEKASKSGIVEWLATHDMAVDRWSGKTGSAAPENREIVTHGLLADQIGTGLFLMG